MKLLITGAWQTSPEQINKIKEMGHEVVFMQNEKDNLPCPAETIEGVICNGLFLHHPIEEFAALRYIQVTSAGLDRVPLKYVEEHNIELYNARGVYSIPMAEHALVGVLQLYKQSRSFYENQKAHKWEKKKDLLELNGKRVLIIGFGSVGKECAKRFEAFGCEVVGLDIDTIGRLKEEAEKADVMVLTLPLTEETRGMIDESVLSVMKDTAILVNIARGSIVDEKALIKALPNLGGAVLDVFETEPLSDDSPLWDMNNVILTPHNSFAGDGDAERLDEVIVLNLKEK